MNYERANKNLIKILIILNLGITSISCNSNPENLLLKEETPIPTKTLQVNDEASPSKTVEMFMKLVEQNKVDEAMKLFAKDEIDTANRTKKEAEPFEFNWAKALNERNLVLKKILKEEIKENQAIVEAEIYAKDVANVNTVSIFYLTKKDKDWKLSSIKLFKD